MDEAAIQRVKTMAQEALSDMPTAGVVGLAAFTEVSRLLGILEKLDAGTAPGAAPQVEQIAKDLVMMSTGFDKGMHKDALEIAFARFATVAEAMARGLSGAKS